MRKLYLLAGDPFLELICADLAQGIPEDKVQILGITHDAFSSSGVFGTSQGSAPLNTPVTPVVGFLGEFERLEFHASAHEIDHIFAVTLADLCDPEQQTDDPRFSSPKFPYPLKIFKGGLFPVWGLTCAFSTQDGTH